MPITFKVARHSANPVRPGADLTGVDSFIAKVCPNEWPNCGNILQSSLSSESLNNIIPKGNGFVLTAFEAYGQHHHLFLVRKPSLCFAVTLSAFPFQCQCSAEELRRYFVAQEGKKELHVDLAGVGCDFGAMAVKFSELLDENLTVPIFFQVVDKTLVEWTLPDFTTSTPHDRIICSVLLITSSANAPPLSRYFDYRGSATCGLPSVTLLGERQTGQLLRPVLRRFVAAFDGAVDLAFWSSIVLHDAYLCGRVDRMGGWITAFCVWNAEGKWLPRATAAAAAQTGEGVYVLDGAAYPNMKFGDIPVGCSTVDVHVEGRLPCKMLAGHLASAVSNTKGPRQGVDGNTLSPAPQWILYEVERHLENKRRGTEEWQTLWDMLVTLG
ncbi:uncharacterized protein BXZ73DRAFT_88471 [Epithele typhae]|uniref:uncharacterized protein n=1 Tax=Epithele typhae TaxID=378194 RepID=UPI002008BB1E|nr:uncharacterized protein BXZ73DRAFT_88471 [Epithele typhae]KAH9940731.1 hypothetical protein BXZ73DRAFT_88471 [Epithele typhae]